MAFILKSNPNPPDSSSAKPCWEFVAAALICSGRMADQCVFCKREVPTRGHHVVPRSKGGREVAPTCHSCEDFIHKTWSHNELRDAFNSVEKILADARFQRFLRWLYKQQSSSVFRTRRNRSRHPNLYR